MAEILEIEPIPEEYFNLDPEVIEEMQSSMDFCAEGNPNFEERHHATWGT